MRSISTIFFLFIYVTCFGQTNVRAILDSLIKRTKQTSMYVHLVNWDSLEREVYLKAEHSSKTDELKPAFETLLNGILDKHGKILDAKSYKTVATFTAFDKLKHPDKRTRDSESWEIVNNPTSQFEYKILKGKIGYLKIVGIPPNVDIAKEAQKIRNAVIELTDKKIDKWIIDLRYNGGGNMNPMVSGIAPLIGDGKVGYLKNLNGENLFDWEIIESNFLYYGNQAITLLNKPRYKKLPKVAVLTSKWTVSSGEIVATCFKGRPNSKFFGEMTGGYTTNNNWEMIDDQFILSISTGIYCDRNGIAYEHNIPVDVEIPFEVVNDPEKDNCILQAKKWLKTKI